MSGSPSKIAMWNPGIVSERARQHMAATDAADLRTDIATARAVRDILVDRFEADLGVQDGAADAGDLLRSFDSIAKLARAQHQKETANAIPAQKVAQLLQEMQRVVESYVHDDSTRANILTAWRQIVVG